jgi:hypothetical protein
MANNDKIVKIYDISAIGTDEVIQDLNTINKQFVDIKKNKLSLNGLKAQIEDPAELKKIDSELAKLLLAEKKLAVELKQKQVTMKEYQLIQAAEREAKKKEAAGNTALAGSYNEVNKKYKELLAISKSTTNLMDPAAVKAAQDELMKLKAQLDNFSRGLTKDGTLVGEYTTGILQAFKNSGLDDVIKDQLLKAKQNVTQLDQEFEKLRQELSDIKVTGQGSLQVVEQQLLDNRKAAQGFVEQINRVEGELRSMSSSGSSIGATIGLQFKNLKQDVAGFVLGFVGIQAAISSVSEFVGGSIEEFEQAEQAVTRFQNRLKNLGREKELTGINQSISELAGQFKSIDNDDLTNAAEKLVTYGKVSEAQIKQLLPVIVDFAANAGISIQESTDAVIKGLEGNGKALKVYGIDMKDAGNEAEAYALIHDVLGAKVRGSAAVFASTASGELAAQKQALKDQQEILGEKLIPLYVKLATILATVAGAVMSIQFGWWVAGISAVTTALALYKTEQIRAYVATQLATQGTILNRLSMLAGAAATRIQALATRAATYEVTLFNGAIKMTPFGWMITALTTIVFLFSAFSAKAASSSKSLRASEEAMKDFNSAIEEGTKAAAQEISALDKMYKATQDVTKTMAERRKEAVEMQKTYPKTFANFTTEEILAGNAATAYNTLRDAILAASRAKALSAKLDEFAGQNLVNEKAIADAKAGLERAKANEQSTTSSQIGNVGRSTKDFDPAYSTIKRSQDGTIEAQKTLEKAIAAQKQLQADYKYFLDEKEKLEKEATKNKDKPKPTPTGVPTVTLTGGDKKPKDTKDPKEVNRIEDLKKIYEQELKALEANISDKLITEAQYYEKQIALADLYRNQKLTAIAKLSKDEKESQASFNADLAKTKADAIQKQFDTELAIIAKAKQEQEAALQLQQSALDGNKSIGTDERLQQQIAIDTQRYTLATDYFTSVEDLENKYSLLSQEDASERANAILTIEQKLGQDRIDQYNQQYDKLTAAQKEALRKLQADTTNQAIGILTGDGSAKEKQDAIKKLEEQATLDARNLRLSQIDAEILANKTLLDNKAINQEEYNKRVAELEDEKLDVLKAKAEAELKIDEEKQQKKEEFIKLLQDSALQAAEKFANAYIQTQQAEVESNYKATQEKLGIEKDQRLSQAQSKAEEETIKREYEAKEKEAARKRNKERQDVARKQLAIEFALASIKAISTSPDIASGFVKVGLVLAEYLASLAVLNKQQFAFSGKVQPERLTDGLINTRPNVSPTKYGDNVLAYVKPGEVILNKHHQAMLGGDSTFANIGVPGFGSSVQPPIFRSYYATATTSSNNNSNDIAEMKAIVYGLAEVIQQESYKPVMLDTNRLAKHQDNQAKKINLATI